jgi:hypothetical protein
MEYIKFQNGDMTETIDFQIEFTAEFWDLKPKIDIFVDEDLVWTDYISEKKCRAFFTKTLTLDKNHTLKIDRSNKHDHQCQLSDNMPKDQYVIIDQVIIDGIDVQNLIWHRSWYEPRYSDTWKQTQVINGVVLEETVIGETWFGHNGTWYFNFTSPFYQFVIGQFRS